MVTPSHTSSLDIQTHATPALYSRSRSWYYRKLLCSFSLPIVLRGNTTINNSVYISTQTSNSNAISNHSSLQLGLPASIHSTLSSICKKVRLTSGS